MYLYRRFPALQTRLPSLPLRSSEATPATPVRRLKRLEAALGAGTELWVKDDGAYARPYGGNKPRKLEWVLPHVKQRGKRKILTIGGTGTHHGLATAIYAAQQGLGTHIALVDQPETPHARAQLERLKTSGAVLHFTHGPVRTALVVVWLWLRHWAYLLWVGGSSPRGTLGFVEAGLELGEQVRRGELPEPGHVVCALGSGGTAAGLLLGLRLAGLRTRVLAVSVSEYDSINAKLVARLANRTARLLVRHGAELPADCLVFQPEDVEVERNFVGAGYGAPLPAAEDAVIRLQAHEHLALEGVYTGKAMAALLARVVSGRLGPGPVVYWHTYNARSLA